MARRACSPVQPHIRSLLMAAAPTPRIRRAGAGERDHSSRAVFQGSGGVGSFTGIRRRRRRRNWKRV